MHRHIASKYARNTLVWEAEFLAMNEHTCVSNICAMPGVCAYILLLFVYVLGVRFLAEIDALCIGIYSKQVRTQHISMGG